MMPLSKGFAPLSTGIMRESGAREGRISEDLLYGFPTFTQL